MKLKDYIIDTFYIIVLNILFLLLLIIILYLYNFNKHLIILISILFVISSSIGYIITYLKKASFYNDFSTKLNNLDKKYLITEIVTNSNIMEGKILLDYLYDINKAFIEEINYYKNSNKEFKEYIELWCHEIKTPLATSKLIIENNKNKITRSIDTELTKLDNFIEQVLYYSKSDLVYQDYIVKSTNLKTIIETIIKRNKKDLMNKHISIENNVINTLVESDELWLIFIINQIVINSIKYCENDKPFISFDIINNKNNIILNITDNGIGIAEKDINNVFKKGYIGINGRKNGTSTGIGLYLCKKLCEKLGHDIIIASKINSFTKVSIIFPKNSMMLK